MKITYLHGLESDNLGEKNDWLNKHFSTFSPSINYRKEGTFDKLLKGVKGSSLIIGSSMGGYFAYLFGLHTGIPTLLFNPAVIGRSMDPKVEFPTSPQGTKNTVYLGTKDKVIPGSAVTKWFGSDGIGQFNYNTYPGGHRVPFWVFKDAVSKITGVKESNIISFKTFIS